MDHTHSEVKNFSRRAAVTAWLALSLVGTAAGAHQASSQPQPASGIASGQVAAAGTVDPARTHRLIAQLGADEYAVRNAATNALIEIGDEALEALQRAAKSDDPEVALRARIAMRAIQDAGAFRTHRVVDSQGNPIAGIEVVFVAREPHTGHPTSTVVGKTTSDSRGYLSMPDNDVNAASGFAAIADPRLGRAAVQVFQPSSKRPSTLAFPLVSEGTPAHERALKGRVLDEDAKPVARAMISCSMIRTPGEGLISADSQSFVLTDEQGQFAIYPVAQPQGREERGNLIPKNSRFHLTVRPPQPSGLFPASAEAANTQPASLVLQRPKHEHTFKLEKPDGTLARGAELKSAYITYSRQLNQGTLTLDQRLIREGGRLLPGFYTARMGQLEYLPLEVKDDSPRELVFRLPLRRSYRGRIVEGITGKPLEGALVIAMTGVGYNNLAVLTEGDWDSLDKLPVRAPMDLPIVARLRTLYDFLELVRTDADGGYDVTGTRGRQPYALVAFARNRLPYSCHTRSLKDGQDGKTRVPDLRLYPAAKVLVRPVFENGHVSVAYYWSVEREGQPAWASALRGPRWNSEIGFERLHWLKANEQQPLYVPAGVRLKVMFDTPYDAPWTVINRDETLLLDPGQTKDLGDLKIVPSAKVEVRVTDEQGKPVEGVPLRKMQDVQDGGERAWCVAHNTDADGRATFCAPAGSSGKIAIIDFPQRNVPAAKAANVTVGFRVGKDGKQVEPCTIRVTAEQIRLLLGT